MKVERVLVCDPSPQAQRALRLVLREAGYEVVTTATGSAALDAAARERPRAVILELALPDLDGIEVCRRLRRNLEAPILIVSEIDDDEKKIAAFTSGADDYMTKPFNPRELSRASRHGCEWVPARCESRTTGSSSTSRRTSSHWTVRRSTHRHGVRAAARAGDDPRDRQLPDPGPEGLGVRRGEIGSRLRAHVANLRGKLDRGNATSVIRTDIGLGYRFVGREGAPAARSGDR